LSDTWAVGVFQLEIEPRADAGRWVIEQTAGEGTLPDGVSGWAFPAERLPVLQTALDGVTEWLEAVERDRKSFRPPIRRAPGMSGG
jgi:hypothetical protein